MGPVRKYVCMSHCLHMLNLFLLCFEWLFRTNIHVSKEKRNKGKISEKRWKWNLFWWFQFTWDSEEIPGAGYFWKVELYCDADWEFLGPSVCFWMIFLHFTVGWLKICISEEPNVIDLVYTEPVDWVPSNFIKIPKISFKNPKFHIQTIRIQIISSHPTTALHPQLNQP
jgi:hypothetical protein